MRQKSREKLLPEHMHDKGVTFQNGNQKDGTQHQTHRRAKFSLQDCEFFQVKAKCSLDIYASYTNHETDCSVVSG